MSRTSYLKKKTVLFLEKNFRKKGFLQDVRHNLQKAFFKHALGDSSLERDKEKYQYSYEDIIEMLQANVKLTDVHK